MGIETGIAWTDHTAKACWRCKATHARSEFGIDRSRADGLSSSCLASRRVKTRKDMRGIARRVGWLVDARAGDKMQARFRVNYLVRHQRIPAPSALPCADCGHVWTHGERRHEYDHYRGYAAAHHLDVQAVCSTCHRRRTSERGELVQRRNPKGRFVTKETSCG